MVLQYSKIYPNPFNPQLNIQLINVKGRRNVKIVVHDLNGRLIENLYQGKALSFDLNINWSPKRYSIRFISNKCLLC